MGIDSIIIEKLTIPSSLTSLVLVESLIDRVCNTIHVNEDVYGNVLIGVTEAVNNAIIHGNQYSDSKTVSIEVSEDESSFYFRVSDEGLGFDYLNFPEIYTILPEYYFLDSLKFLNLNDNSEIWLFTENCNQAKKYYPKLVEKADKVIDNEGDLSDLESFKLLSKATKLVASNSTFSMWAAWFVNKNGFSAVVPMGFGTKDSGYQLTDERWDRYNLETRVIIPRSKLDSRYLEKKREFLSKFE